MERPYFIFPFFSQWTCRLFLFATMNSDSPTLMYEHWPECLLSCQEGLHHNHAGTLISDCQLPEWPLFINPPVYGMLLCSFSRLRQVCLSALFTWFAFIQCHVSFSPIYIRRGPCVQPLSRVCFHVLFHSFSQQHFKVGGVIIST